MSLKTYRKVIEDSFITIKEVSINCSFPLQILKSKWPLHVNKFEVRGADFDESGNLSIELLLEEEPLIKQVRGLDNQFSELTYGNAREDIYLETNIGLVRYDGFIRNVDEWSLLALSQDLMLPSSITEDSFSKLTHIGYTDVNGDDTILCSVDSDKKHELLFTKFGNSDIGGRVYNYEVRVSGITELSDFIEEQKRKLFYDVKRSDKKQLFILLDHEHKFLVDREIMSYYKETNYVFVSGTVNLGKK